MQECVINFHRIAYACQAMFNKPAPRTANQSIFAGTSPSEVYPCKGGGPNDYCYFYTTRSNNKHWHSLLKVIDREDLLADERLATPQSRAKHAPIIDAILSEWTKTRDKRDVMAIMGNAGVPVSATFDTMELMNDPVLRKRGTFVTFRHPQRGEMTIPGPVIHLSDSHVDIEAPPLVAAHNKAVYGGILGMSDKELAELQEKKVI
jgi:formyl-CoA transferase